MLLKERIAWGRPPFTGVLRRAPWRALVALAVAAIVVLSGSPADAHPLGNFSVNRYARVEVSGPTVRIYYVLDAAEIPAFQERRAVEADEEAFLRSRVASIGDALELRVDGERLALSPVDQSLEQPDGQGGLRTLRVAAIYEATLPAGEGERQLTLADGNEPDRLGWREIVTVARGDARLERTDAPTSDVSDELRDYPRDLTQSPLDLRSASMTFEAGTTDAAVAPLPTAAAARDLPGGTFAALITREGVGAGVLAGMVAVAVAVGAGHALLPGHGKTVMAAYLVGTKGRPIDAVLLGVIVSFMHTASVLVLGLVLFRVGRDAALDRWYPALTAVSGLLAAALGVWLLTGRLRRYRLVRAHRAALADHHHHEHEHEHHHEHEHDHGHHHGPGGHTHELPPDVAPLSRRGLVLLATSGGIVPSPTAVIVIVSAFSLGRVPLGLVLIGAFSIGLAVTLTAVGLALVFGRRVLERHWPGRSIDLLPVLGAVALVGFGLILTARGLTGNI